MEFSHGGFNQDVAKKCGSKWELGKMDRALIRMWQKKLGLNGNLAKWIGLKSGCGKKVWVLKGTWQNG